MVQVTPFRGSNLAQTVLTGAQLQQNQMQNRLAEAALGQRDRMLTLQEQQFAASQKPKPFDARAYTVDTLQKVGNLKVSPERKVDILQETVSAQVLQAVQSGQLPEDQAKGVAQWLMTITPDDFAPGAVEQFSAAFNDLQAKLKMLEDPNLSPQRRRAIEIDLRLRPGAVGNADITLAGGNAGVTPEAVASAAGTVAGGVRAGQDAIEASKEARSQLSGVKRSITNIDDAIKALDDGAQTGAIVRYLPSIRQATIELENVAGRLGLDVVGATTFGALSESELAFAIDTALPTGLNPPQLKAWLERKKAAQSELAQELEAAAIFLGQPGNTVADYMQLMRDNGGVPNGPKFIIEVEP